MKKNILFAIRFAVSFGILLYLLKVIPIEKALETISSAKISLMAVAILLTQLMIYISAVKTKILTDEQNMSLSVNKIFKINYVTQFYGLFLPEVISSGLIRWHKLSKPDGKRAETLALMIFGRSIEIIELLGFGLLFWTLDKSPNSNNFFGMILAGTLLIGVVIYYFAFNRKIALYILRNINRIDLIPKQFIDKIEKLLIATSKYQALKKSSLFQIIGLSILKDMIGIFCYFLVARSVDIHVQFVTLAWIRTYVFTLQLLPISISGIGIQEGSLVFFLGSFGVSTASAVVLSFLLHLKKFVGGAIGGLIEVAELLFFDRKKTEVSKVN